MAQPTRIGHRADPPLGSRGSRIWRIRHHDAIIREIPPRSVRTYRYADLRLSHAKPCLLDVQGQHRS